MSADADLDERPAIAHDTSGDMHIVSAATNPVDSMVYTALCGHGCVIWDDGSTIPDDFDFYLLGHGHEKATCAECKRRSSVHDTCVGCTCTEVDE